MDNPFTAPITRMLEESNSWSEHQILSRLVEDGLLDRDYGRDSLALFQAHFLAMNALYEIQSLSVLAGRYLQISALKIQWLNLSPGDSTALSPREENLRGYYCDWSNFTQASTQSVESLLDGFWRRFLSQDEKQVALNILDLQEPLEFSDIKKRYRQLAMEHHPDRGGSDQQLAKINDAYDVLRRCYTAR